MSDAAMPESSAAAGSAPPRRAKRSWQEAYRLASEETAALACSVFEHKCRSRRLGRSAQPQERMDEVFASLFLPPKRAAHPASYYGKLHSDDPNYQANNWLLEQAEEVLSVTPRSLTELACGNGRFLRKAAESVERVTGVDFARSPLLDDLPANVEFVQGDITALPIPQADLICSADFLEHLEGRQLRGVVRRMHDAGASNYHVIACYDDRHSHSTIVSPGIWLALFRTINASYRLESIDCRREDAEQLVCVITNRPRPDEAY